MSGTNPKTTLYVGGLEESVDAKLLHSAFIPFGDVKDINIPLDQTTQKHRGFGFIEFQDKEDASAAIDNMHNAELNGRVLTVNYAQPIKTKGGEQGWANKPVWADADTWFERQQQEEEMQRLQVEHEATIAKAKEQAQKEAREGAGKEDEEVEEEDGEAREQEVVLDGGQQGDDPMAAAEAEAQTVAGAKGGA